MISLKKLCLLTALTLLGSLSAGNVYDLPPSRIPGDVKIASEWTVYGPYSTERKTLPPALAKGKLPGTLTIAKVTRKARKVQPVNGLADLKKLFGKEKGKTAYVCIPLSSSRGGTAVIGLGADYWFHTFLNGKALFSAGDHGNVLSRPKACHHLIRGVFPKGKSMLVVELTAGTGGFALTAAGSAELRRWPQHQWIQALPPPPPLLGMERFPAWEKWQKKGFVSCQVRKEGIKLVTGKKPGILSCRLTIDPGKQYLLELKTAPRTVSKSAFIALRALPVGGDVYLLREISGFKRSGFYCYLENPRPYFEIHCPPGITLELQKISLKRSLDPGKSYRNWPTERIPEYKGMRGISRQVKTPSFIWGNPGKGTPLKVLMLTSFWYQRYAEELEQRFNVRCEVLPFMAPYEKPDGLWVMRNGQPVRKHPLYESLKSSWKKHECIVIDMLNACSFTPELIDKILDRVASGAGLVIVGLDQLHYPYKDGNDLVKALNKFKEDRWQKALNPSTAVKQGSSQVRVTAVEKPEYEFFRWGRGRIVYLRRGGDKLYKRPWQFERRAAVLGKAVRWAAGKDTDALITETKAAGDRVTVRTAGKLENARVFMSITDEHYRRLFPLQEAPVKDGMARFTLPEKCSGEVYLQLLLKKKDRTVDWDLLHARIVRERRLRALKMENSWMPLRPGMNAKGSAALFRPLRENERVEITLRDSRGRVWYRSSVKGKGVARIPIDAAPGGMRVLAGKITVTFYRNDTPLESLSRDIILKKPKHSPEAGFHFGLMGSQLNSYFFLARMKELYGLDFIATANTAEGVVQATDLDIFCYTNGGFGSVLWGRNNIIEGSGDAPRRQLCLTSSQLLKRAASWIRTYSARAYKYGSFAYVLDHEVDLLGYIRRAKANTDICFSPTCLAHLRRMLKEEYGTLANLNFSWNSAFKSWDEVIPETLDNVKKSGAWPRWIDHRRNMDKVFTDLTRYRMEHLRRMDPDAEGFDMNVRSGPGTNDSFSGVDYEQLFQHIGGSSLPEYFQKYLIPESRKGAIDWQNGAMWNPFSFSGNPRITADRMARQIWNGLVWQRWGYVLYTWIFRPYQRFCRNDSFLLRPDLSQTDMGKQLGAELKQIRSGVDTALLDAEMDDSGIGMLYSRTSEHAATLWRSLLPGNRLTSLLNPRRSQFSFWEPGITAAGRSLRSVSSTQIRQGLLRSGKLKVLILPFCQNLDKKDAAEIREFVRKGGILWADLRPAVADLHGKTGKAGLLDDLFGIRQSVKPDSFVPVTAAVTVPGYKGPAIAGAPLQLRGGKALGKGRVPVYIVNRYGKGKTVLLNFYMEGTVTAPLFEKLLKDAGIPELFSCRASGRVWKSGEDLVKEGSWKKDADLQNKDYEIDSEDNGDVESMMFTGVQDFNRRYRYRKGRISYYAYSCSRNANVGEGTQKLTLSFPESGHIYDLRRGKYLGVQKSFTITSSLEPSEFFAVTPYLIEAPRVTLSRVRPEKQDLRITVSSAPRPAAAAKEGHVMRLELKAPDGSDWSDLTVKRITRNGKAAHTFILPLSAPRGTWQVTVREALSGKKTTVSFTLPRK